MTIDRLQFSDEQLEQFDNQGFLILEQCLDLALVDRIDARLDPLFATQFETGVYPDEWHGRPGLNQPTATRQMCGMWRCDRTIASLSLSAAIARLNATLMGWRGGRLATDSCWLKPPGAPEVLFHRNNTAVACIDPSSVITCWIALSDTTSATGTLEVVPGSHQWHCSDQFRFLHAPQEDYRQPLWAAAREASVHQPDIVAIEIPAGGCIFLHGNLWHGSGRNITTDQTRRSFAITTLPVDVRFQPPEIRPGYIFNRYRRIGETAMDESFFPILWTQTGDRTPMVLAYCDDVLAAPAVGLPL